MRLKTERMVVDSDILAWRDGRTDGHTDGRTDGHGLVIGAMDASKKAQNREKNDCKLQSLVKCRQKKIKIRRIVHDNLTLISCQ